MGEGEGVVGGGADHGCCCVGGGRLADAQRCAYSLGDLLEGQLVYME